MRTPTALWVASIAMAGMQGPFFITAQAAPAPQAPAGRLRPRYYVPRRVKRQSINDIAVNDTLPAFAGLDPQSSSSPLSTEIITSTAVVIPVPASDLPPVSQTSTPIDGSGSSSSSILLVVPAVASYSGLTSAGSSNQPSASSAAPTTPSDPSSGPVPLVVIPASQSPSPASSSSIYSPVDPLFGATSSLPPVSLPSASGGGVPLNNPSPSSAVSVPLVTSSPSSSSGSGIIVGLGTIISDAAGALSSSLAIPLVVGSVDPNSTPNSILSVVPLLGTGIGTGSAALPTFAPTQSVPGVLPALGSLASGLAQTLDGGSSVVPVATSAPSTTPLLPLVIPVPSVTVTLPSSQVTVIPESLPPVPNPTGTGLPISPPISASTPNSLLPDATTPTDTATKPVIPVSLVPSLPTAKSDATVSTTTGLVTPDLVPITKPGSVSQYTVVPTSTDTNTQMTLPTAILVQPSETGAASPVAATGIPTSMPKLIQPPGGKPSKPSNSTLVQIGFYHELNYAFVSTNSQSASQIFEFLPSGVGYGIASGEATMQSIQPYDTSKSLGYITTLALMYIPSELVNRLSVDLHTPNSGLYQNPDPTVATLMGLINPSFPLLAGQSIGDGSSSGSSPSASSSPGATNGANPFGPDAANNEPVRTTAAVMTVPVAAGALLYGSAMVFVARRYRKRRLSHRRTSSVTGGASFAAGPEFGNASRDSRGSGNTSGRSARTQQISAPVMSENSLGWN